MSKKLLKYNEPLFSVRSGEPVNLLYRFPNGNLVVAVEGASVAGTVNKYGYGILGHGEPISHRITNEAPCTIEYLSLYPNGNVYKKECCPIKDSSYGVENLIQIKVTRRGNKIISKEFV